jgi:hypothetical protein
MANLNMNRKNPVFFNKPSSGLSTNAQIAANAYVVFAGRNQQVDISYWTNLVAAGLDRQKIGWYGKADNFWAVDQDILDPPGTPCSNNQPNRNSIVGEEICDQANARDDVLAADSSDWMLRKLSDGSIVLSQSANVNKYVHCDIGLASYRNQFKTRFESYFNALDPDDRPGFIWLDNGRDNPYFTGTSLIRTQQYPSVDGSDWFAAFLDWLDWLIDNVCVPNGVGLAVNVQTTGSAITRWKEYIDVMARLVDVNLMARTFIEFYASTSSGDYEGTLNLWLKSPLKMQYAESRGVAVDCCIQLQGDLVQSESNATINAKARFTLASWLLACGSRSTIRYSDDDNSNGVGYGYFNVPPLLTTYASIRQPVGAMYSTGTGIYRRDFVDGGYVICNYSNPSAPTYDIVFGVGSTKKPLASFLGTDMTAAVNDTQVWQVFAEAQDGGTLSYAVQTGALPPGRTINASTGRVSGTYTTQGTYSGTIRVSESGGGGFVDIPFTEEVDPAPPVPTANYVIGINYGGTQQTMSNGDVFENGTAATFGTGTGVGFTCTQNGATDGSSASAISRDASVPTHWTDAMFLDWLNDTTNPPPIVVVTEALNCDIRIGFNSGTTPAGRVVDVYINNVFQETINFATIVATETAFVRMYSNIAPSGGTFTIEARRNAGATVSSRIMVMDMVSIPPVIDPPVLDPIGDKSVDEAANLNFTITATADTGIAILDADTLSGVSPFDLGASFIDNEDDTGTFNWTPTYAQSGVYEVTFSATDPTDPTKVTTETITITVNHVNLPPVWNPISNITMQAGSIMNVPISATDADGDTLTLSLADEPTWATLIPTGNGTATLNLAPPGNDDVGTYPAVTAIASDGTVNVPEFFDITVTEIPPVPPQGQPTNPTQYWRARWHVPRGGG